MPPNSKLDFKCLCKKLVILLLILGASRKQALISVTVESVLLDHHRVTLLPNKTLKHSTSKSPLKPFVHHSYKENAKLQIVNRMQFYLGETNCKVDDNNKNLTITYGKPYKNVSADSISRWVKKELTNAGIDTNIYKVHSCRTASSSKIKQIRISVPVILKRGCWKTNITLKKFYDKDISSNITNDCRYYFLVIDSGTQGK